MRLLLPMLLLACAGSPEGLRATPPGDGPLVRVDFDAEPLPDIPFPNDLATRADPTSVTGLRVNISVDAAGAFKGRLQDEATGLALVLSEKAGISMRRAMRLLLQLHVLVVGMRQIARPPAAVATALERPGL